MLNQHDNWRISTNVARDLPAFGLSQSDDFTTTFSK